MKRIPSLLALCIAGAALLEGDSRAANDRQLGLFELAPPIPAPVNLTLRSRDQISIILKVAGLQAEPATFRLRSPAEHGTIQLLPQVSKEWAQADYLPPQDRNIKFDTFRFVVSNSKGTSSESIAKIQFKDIGPRLECPHKVDFGALRIGDVVTETIAILNSGDTVATGSILVTGEWSIGEEGREYRIEPGKSESIRVVLRPKSTGKLEGALIMGEEPSQRSLLQARVSAWIGASPDPLFLADKDGRERSAELVLFNETSVPEQVSIGSVPRLEHPKSVWVPAGESVSVPLSTPNPSPMEQQGKLVLSGSRARERVLLWKTAAFGPALGGVDRLGTLVVPGAGKTIRLWNEGGRPGIWNLKTYEPFRILVSGTGTAAASSTSATLKLAPGEAVEATLKYQAKVIPKKPGALEIHHLLPPRVAGGTFKTIALVTRNPQAILAPPSDSPKDLVLLSAPKPEALDPAADVSFLPSFHKKKPAEPLPEPESPLTSAIFNFLTRKPDPKQQGIPKTESVHEIQQHFLPGILLTGLRISDITHDSATLKFPAPQHLQPEDILVLVRDVQITDDGKPKVSWSKVKSKAGGNKKEGFVIKLRGLTPGRSNAIRLLGPKEANGSRIALHQSQIDTPEMPHWLSPTRPWIWLLGGAGLGSLLFLRQSRNSRRSRR